MKENNINEYDEDLFKVHEVLKKLDEFHFNWYRKS